MLEAVLAVAFAGAFVALSFAMARDLMIETCVQVGDLLLEMLEVMTGGYAMSAERRRQERDRRIAELERELGIGAEERSSSGGEVERVCGLMSAVMSEAAFGIAEDAGRREESVAALSKRWAPGGYLPGADMVYVPRAEWMRLQEENRRLHEYLQRRIAHEATPSIIPFGEVHYHSNWRARG